MDYSRTNVAHLPVRAMGSPDGLGAYFANQYVQGISRDPGGTNTIASYQPIGGLGCGPCAAAAAASGVGEMPAALSNTWVRVGLGLGVVAIGWFALKPKLKKNGSRRRHRRNHKIPLRRA